LLIFINITHLFLLWNLFKVEDALRDPDWVVAM
jgi:hypothetical protein